MDSLFDLSKLSFDEFVSLFFDHDIATEEYRYKGPDFANINDFDDEGVNSPAVVVEHMTRLFTNFANVVSKFSLPQINSAVWAMFTYGAFRLQKHLWLSSVPLTQRINCVRSMYFVYSDFVAKSTVPVMENCFDMWWDFVGQGFWEQLLIENVKEGDVGALNEEQKTLLDALLETLTRILALPDKRTQGYALHGLGHLHHPGVRETVQRFLDDHRHELPPDGIRWVEMCRDGTVM